MDKKMFDRNKVAEKANRIINRAKDSVVGVIDQNSDGEFNSKDISLIADSIKQSVAEKKKEAELESLRPVFLDDLDRTDFFMSKMICISEIDKKHADSELCANSIGHRAVQGDLDIVYLYKDKLDCFGLSFFPDKESTIYYVDPSDRDNYIALDDYFGYLRIARVNELQKIAQDLGAKHFRVTFKEQKKTAGEKNAKAKAKVKATKKQGGDAEAAHSFETKEEYSVSVAAEMDCPGHAPFEPELKYWLREPSIQTLVALRMDEKSPLTHQKYTLELSKSSGLKEKDAIKIDAALQAMKISAGASVASEAKNEARRFFEYEIDF